jgi:bla regulator protein BlaR1
MKELFKSVLLLSLMGTVLSGVLLLLKPVTKRVFGSHWQYYIWLSVLVVMVLPVSFKMPVKTDLYTTIPANQQIIQENNTAQTPVNAKQKPVFLNGQTPAGNRYIDIVQGITPSLLDVFVYVWLFGAAIFFCGGIISYLRFLRTIRKNSFPVICPALEEFKLAKGIRQKIRVRTARLLTAPLIVGVFNPTLLLPNAAVSEKQLHYILLHELTHLKRHDLLYKWFAMIVNAVHWFNPFAYFVARQINEACEISCDLSVTKGMSADEKNGYMNTIVSLLSMNKEKSKLLTTAMASDKKQIKNRFIIIRKA